MAQNHEPNGKGKHQGQMPQGLGHQAVQFIQAAFAGQPGHEGESRHPHRLAENPHQHQHDAQAVVEGRNPAPRR